MYCSSFGEAGVPSEEDPLDELLLARVGGLDDLCLIEIGVRLIGKVPLT